MGNIETFDLKESIRKRIFGPVHIHLDECLNEDTWLSSMVILGGASFFAAIRPNIHLCFVVYEPKSILETSIRVYYAPSWWKSNQNYVTID